MNLDRLKDTPHRRFNPLTQEWVIVSPHRTERPWRGQGRKCSARRCPHFDPDCYLCPGNTRAGGSRNPKYATTFVFDNDYAALLPEPPQASTDHDDLLIAGTERGICRVGCFSPRHDLTIPRMSVRELRPVADMWIDQFNDLAGRAWVKHVQIFENRGAMMGASNHPHCQIWATAHLPNQAIREQRRWALFVKAPIVRAVRLPPSGKQSSPARHLRTIPSPYSCPSGPSGRSKRSSSSKRHTESIADLDENERNLLGDILQQIAIRYDNLFEVSFPYSMGFHQRPTDGERHPEWHLHAHFYPPLLRSATIQKFMVGYEMLGGPQRDITPEAAADRLQNVSRIHFRDRA
jgi:UDPglucose--hexose-1-phosphate uridylyltransferase